MDKPHGNTKTGQRLIADAQLNIAIDPYTEKLWNQVRSLPAHANLSKRESLCAVLLHFINTDEEALKYAAEEEQQQK